MQNTRVGAVAFGTAVHLARFAVLYATLLVAPLLGISGWWLGFTATVMCTVFAVAAISAYGLWRRVGVSMVPPGRFALLALVPFAAEALAWAVPSGILDRPPGPALWAVSLLLVGVNEELVSRGVVLSRLETVYPPWSAAAITGSLFGLQHLSAFATTSRGVLDIVGNVAASTCFGFALAAYQSRFRWILPLIVLHAAIDVTTILSARPFTDAVIAAISVGYLVFGAVLLTRRPSPDEPA